MTPPVRWLEVGIAGAYLLGLTSLGLGFAREQTTTQQYFLARRSIPAWATGMSLLTLLIHGVASLGLAGWNIGDSALVLIGILGAVVAVAAGAVPPFYREASTMSAYEYFGQRFGRAVRWYAAIAFLVEHFSRAVLMLYLLGSRVQSSSGWSIDRVIAVVGLMTILYTARGGLEAVIWTSAMQGALMCAAVVSMFGYGWLIHTAGPARALPLTGVRWAGPPSGLVAIYCFFWSVQWCAADQGIVQRYLAAKTDRAARKGAALAGVICLMGAALFLAAPIFPSLHAGPLPGMTAVTLTIVVGALVCGFAADLNSFALVAVEDLFLSNREAISEAGRMRLSKAIVILSGLCCMAATIAFAHGKGPEPNTWIAIAMTAGGGIAGIFLLAFFSSRASRRGVWTGIIAALAFTGYGIATGMDKFAVGALAHVVVLAIGCAVSFVWPDPLPRKPTGMTIWQWRRLRRRGAFEGSK